MAPQHVPSCRFCETVAMTISVRPAIRADLRIAAWLMVALGLAIGMFSHGQFSLVLGGLVLAIVALPLTDQRLVRVSLCPNCGHYFPYTRQGESPVVEYQWRPLPTVFTIAGIVALGMGFWVVMALYGWDTRVFGQGDAIIEKLRIALGFAVIIAVACVLIESLEHYPQEPFLWRALSMTALLLGLGTTANAATTASWLVVGPAHEWIRLGILTIGEAIILVMAMRRSRLFTRIVELPGQSSESSAH